MEVQLVLVTQAAVVLMQTHQLKLLLLELVEIVLLVEMVLLMVAAVAVERVVLVPRAVQLAMLQMVVSE